MSRILQDLYRLLSHYWPPIVRAWPVPFLRLAYQRQAENFSFYENRVTHDVGRRTDYTMKRLRTIRDFIALWDGLGFALLRTTLLSQSISRIRRWLFVWWPVRTNTSLREGLTSALGTFVSSPAEYLLFRKLVGLPTPSLREFFFGRHLFLSYRSGLISAIRMLPYPFLHHKVNALVPDRIRRNSAYWAIAVRSLLFQTATTVSHVLLYPAVFVAHRLCLVESTDKGMWTYVLAIVKDTWHADGLRGFYRGFGFSYLDSLGGALVPLVLDLLHERQVRRAAIAATKTQQLRDYAMLRNN